MTPDNASFDSAFIAADVGGTHVRIGLVQASGDAAHPIRVLEYRKYVCADYGSLADIIEDFLHSLPGVAVSRGVIASAGYPLEDGTVITTNLPWRLSPQDIRQRLGFADLRLVNDFEAVAHAAAQVDASEVLQLAGPASAAVRGPTLILGPGTGLGAAVWIPAGKRAVVLPTEAGQAALTAGNATEMALLAQMLKTRSHVPIEYALSGPGLMNLYTALCALRGARPVYAQPGEITAAAIAGNDPLARESLEVFCGLLGSAVGDMALLYGVQGGVYLAGGILPQIRDFLLHSSFVERFLNKGPMREALERIPVKLVEHGQLGVIGAASWYLGQRNGD
ncbi:glucokinase family protein [Pseudoxanthomonas wuyuanensis]|jgi:glucokinase|uniref:Glucokinase n=1 Tax=Pseudoxanthomonas wuyuanensis TaxID=1073196 RepID=A0A286DA42_9GAMM|nr:glucokinase family protein [Pseudoxanthomonas wuyuanensis]KAF1720504.1 glucokinase [Pseudoxanthomonas wuyuanensis]SOD55492.1 glucokinase [Pseudoxanthomonas wuyuanensis]